MGNLRLFHFFLLLIESAHPTLSCRRQWAGRSPSDRNRRTKAPSVAKSWYVNHRLDLLVKCKGQRKLTIRFHSIGSNQLLGTIPTELGNCKSLTQVELANNKFENRIPTQLGALSRLERLDLQNNMFFGNVPTELTTLSKLTVLYLGNNALIGNFDPLFCDRPETFPSWTVLETDCVNTLVTCSCCTSCCNGLGVCCAPGSKSC
jgi:hypothetical protein